MMAICWSSGRCGKAAMKSRTPDSALGLCGVSRAGAGEVDETVDRTAKAWNIRSISRWLLSRSLSTREREAEGQGAKWLK